MSETLEYIKDINANYPCSVAIDHENGNYYFYDGELEDMLYEQEQDDYYDDDGNIDYDDEYCDFGNSIFDTCSIYGDSDQPLGSVNNIKQLIELIICNRYDIDYDEDDDNKIVKYVLNRDYGYKDNSYIDNVEENLKDLGLKVDRKDISKVLNEIKELMVKDFLNLVYDFN